MNYALREDQWSCNDGAGLGPENPEPNGWLSTNVTLSKSFDPQCNKGPNPGLHFCIMIPS